MNPNPERQQWLDALVQRHEQPLCRYAYSLLGSLSAAQDAVQETFLRLCRENPDKLAGHEAAWLFRVCRSRALDALRKEKPMQPLSTEQSDHLPAAGPTPAQHVVRGESETLTLRLLEALPAREREVIRLKFQQGLSYREIARITRLTESHIGVLIHTGMKSLRHQMALLQGVAS
jgi:RNA polymerase sigma factor (sigma-70 family)